MPVSQVNYLSPFESNAEKQYNFRNLGTDQVYETNGKTVVNPQYKSSSTPSKSTTDIKSTYNDLQKKGVNDKDMDRKKSIGEVFKQIEDPTKKKSFVYGIILFIITMYIILKK